MRRKKAEGVLRAKESRSDRSDVMQKKTLLGAATMVRKVSKPKTSCNSLLSCSRKNIMIIIMKMIADDSDVKTCMLSSKHLYSYVLISVNC